MIDICSSVFTAYNSTCTERRRKKLLLPHGQCGRQNAIIGLAIAKKVVENHDGIITAEGKENEGATIHIFLPA